MQCTAHVFLEYSLCDQVFVFTNFPQNNLKWLVPTALILPAGNKWSHPAQLQKSSPTKYPYSFLKRAAWVFTILRINPYEFLYDEPLPIEFHQLLVPLHDPHGLMGQYYQAWTYITHLIPLYWAYTTFTDFKLNHCEHNTYVYQCYLLKSLITSLNFLQKKKTSLN